MSVNFTGTGTDYPIFDDIRKYVVEAGKAAGDGTSLGQVQYNRALYAAMLAAEAIKTAQERHGVSEIDREMMRDGMENLEITEEKLEALGLPGFGPTFQVSCENHSGPGKALVQQWDAEAQTWTAITQFMVADRELLMPLIMEDSMSYAEENGIEPRC